jgi:hypothetical protein
MGLYDKFFGEVGDRLFKTGAQIQAVLLEGWPILLSTATENATRCDKIGRWASGDKDGGVVERKKPAMKRAAIRLVADDLSISMDELRRHFLVVDEDNYRLDDAYRLVDAHRLATRKKYTFTWQRCLCSAGSTL